MNNDSNKYYQQFNLNQEQAINAWEKICEGLYHFNRLSNGCRLLASTWLLGSFAAIGYVSTKKLPIEPQTLVPVLCVFSSLGILMLWLIDQLVYIRFISAYFYEALTFERNYHFLPKANDNMPILFGKKGVINYVRIYYSGCVMAPLLIALLVVFHQNLVTNKYFVYILYAVASVIIISIGLFLFFQKPEYQKIEEEKKKKAKQTDSQCE